ncbi:discoidin domain-containing protein [Thermotoga sp. KOL6]|uniref:endo-beta-N-acetylglucosaminidase n=1 Tax=Thermotoga sp. KOL6 TaxID=126741 RepID=UPI000C77AD1E|nr:discoidin domain-containing protein [Thermotoga sp. KOL6]PLV60428.1 glycoside hydrolase [Thermotoga sp. KOL6]
MKSKFLLLVFSILFVSMIFSNIPESSYWFPNDLLDWSPSNDPNAVYNRSHVPLAKRIIGDPITDVARKDMKIMVLSIMNPSTSGMPSQGLNNSFKTYPFSFWQYVDYLVAWAGSAGEGIIVPPSADVIDVAHKNGVPVLGTIFFPPNVYGGRRNWVDQFLRKEDGRFPIADKLIEVAEYYGFDGWFINQETNGCKPEHAKLMREFIRYIKTKAPWMIIVWYDAMTKTGEIEWQGELNEKNVVFLVDDDGSPLADSIFIDYRWQSLKREKTIENTLSTMEKYGINPDRVFLGIDLQANGYNTYANFPKNQNEDGSLKLPLALYCPSWSYYSSKTIEEFWRKEETLWIADHPTLVYSYKEEFINKDWGDYPQYRWQSPAKFVVEKSPITELPFVTYFCAGHGKSFFVNGKKLSGSEWNNRSLMDVFPTYRWKVEGPIPTISVDYSTAYYGGSSLRISGKLSKDETTIVTLYLADLNIDQPVTLESAIKGKGDISVSLVLTMKDGLQKEYPLILSEDWNITKYILDIKGVVRYISLKIKGLIDTEYAFNIGMIKIVPRMTTEPDQVKNIKIDATEFENGIYAQIRLHWYPVKGAEYYEIYRLYPNGNKELVWVTYNNYTYIAHMKRFGKEKVTTLQVVAVSKDRNRGKPGEVTFEWPPYPAPKADFEVSNTIIAPGETVSFRNLSSEVTEKVVWILPGATPSVSREWNPTVKYLKEGIYPAALIAINTEGEDAKLVNPMIVVTTRAKEVKNLALGKRAFASSHVPAEKPELAVDGTVENNSKWCAVGKPPHWLVIDFGKEVIVNRVVIKHAEEGHESPDWNTKDYRIQVSNDLETWKDVVIVKGNTKSVTEHAFPPVKARYLRLFVETPTQVGDTAARIYEVEVYGLESF